MCAERWLRPSAKDYWSTNLRPRPGHRGWSRDVLQTFFVAAFVATFVEMGVGLTSRVRHAIGMFAHDKLAVYRKALQFAAAASGFVLRWESKHAVTDQLDRASDSLVVNLAEAARHRSPPSKLRILDYSMGSCLECAACLDIAQIKALLTDTDAQDQKKHLSEIMKMLVGLRKAWATWEGGNPRLQS